MQDAANPLDNTMSPKASMWCSVPAIQTSVSPSLATLLSLTGSNDTYLVSFRQKQEP